ncbi:hypothetical protein B0H14DRAFT_3735454 [Mycena olivaceomarginata]|nr:hypothetical protein B0H14DRAFT_3735454 [Mycena olivaceomarginata]
MLDPVYMVLIVCLVLSHLSRLQWLIALGYNYLTRPRPQLIPYFDTEGQLIGMVRLRPDPQSLRQLELRAGPTEAQEHRSCPEMCLLENRVSRQSHEQSQPTPALDSIAQIPFSWDFWPDGQFQSSVSPREITDTHKLATNWVLETVRSRGSPGALTWQKGHELRRQCVGVIKCHNDTCSLQLAPAPRAIDRYTQIQHPCPICGDALTLSPCGIESSLYRFRDGGLFIHRGNHNHLIFTHSSQNQPNGSLGFVDYEPKYTAEPVHTSVAASSHPSPDASEDGSENESTASWYGIYSKKSIRFKTLTDQSCKEGKQVNVSMDDMFSEAEEFEVQMDAEADENEEGVLEDEEEWEVQRDPEANESEEGEDEWN